MNCSGCGQDLTGVEVKSGVSKKNGKGWKAQVCPKCEKFNFIKTEPKPQAPASNDNNVLLQILAELKSMNRTLTQNALSSFGVEEE